MPLKPTKYVNGRMWPPGQSGNPNGRPVGRGLVSPYAQRANSMITSVAPSAAFLIGGPMQASTCSLVRSGLWNIEISKVTADISRVTRR
jgi:hypothetical protein